MLKRQIFVRARQVFFACLLFAQFAFVQIPTRVVYAANESADNLIISAVQITGGTGHTQEDFVELYNPTDLPIDLNGMRLVKRTATGITDSLIKSWSQPTVILAHHFYLWANSGFAGITTIADVTTSTTLADNNGVALRYGQNDTGVIIDSVSWGSSANGFAVVSDENPIANNSLQRTDLFSKLSLFTEQSSSPRNSLIEFLPEVTAETNPPAEPNVEPDNSILVPEVETPQIESTPVENPISNPQEPVTPNSPPESTTILPKLKITELLPNPIGDDGGFEQIEIYNSGESVVDMKDFKLDDVLTNDSVSSNSLTVDNISVEPDSYVVITIPKGKFSLNNSGGDVVTLFDNYGKPIDTVFYEESAPEGQSWANNSNNWQWTSPSLGEPNPAFETTENASPVPEEEEIVKPSYNNHDIVISEVYPQPNEGEQEFIELYNSGEETALLSELDLYIGDRKKQLPEQELLAGEYYVINQSDFPLQLRNSGQEIKLQEGSNIINKVSYPVSSKGQSYALFEDGFIWTTNITKNAQNILELPLEVKKATLKIAEKTTIKALPKETVKKTVKTTNSKVTNTKNTTTKAKASSQSTDQQKNSNQSNKNSQNLEAPKKSAKNSDSLAKIIAMGAASVAAGVIALYKFIFTAGIE